MLEPGLCASAISGASAQPATQQNTMREGHYVTQHSASLQAAVSSGLGENTFEVRGSCLHHDYSSITTPYRSQCRIW